MQNRLTDDKFLEAIFADPKASDRTIARRLKVSQPTVTRKRSQLNAAGIFKYSVIPDFDQLGYNILAISEIPLIASTEEAKKGEIYQDKDILFAMRGVHGILVISRHKTIESYYDFTRKHFITETCFVPTSKGIIKNFNFSKL